MNKDKYNKLKDLEEQIYNVKRCLEYTNVSNLRVGYLSSYSIETVGFRMPDELSYEILGSMKEWLSNAQAEFDKLMNGDEPVVNEEPIKKPWYKFW